MIIMGKKFLEMDKQFDDEGNITVLLQIDTELIRKGILKELTPSQLKVLIVVSAHSDDNGEAFPSLRYIAEATGIALSTVDTAVKGLLKLRIDGQPIMTREIKGDGARKKSVYNFEIEEAVTVTTSTEKSPKTFLDMFCGRYSAEYGSKYKVSGQKDMQNLKRMMKVYSPEEMEIIIITIMEEYKKRWSSVKFPAPTIGAMASFLCVQAMEIHSKRAVQSVSKWDNLENDDESLDL